MVQPSTGAPSRMAGTHEVLAAKARARASNWRSLDGPEALHLERMAIGRHLHQQGARRRHALDLRRKQQRWPPRWAADACRSSCDQHCSWDRRSAHPGGTHPTRGQASLHDGPARGGDALPHQHRLQLVEVAPDHQHRLLVEVVQRRRYAHDMAGRPAACVTASVTGSPSIRTLEPAGNPTIFSAPLSTAIAGAGAGGGRHRSEGRIGSAAAGARCR